MAGSFGLNYNDFNPTGTTAGIPAAYQAVNGIVNSINNATNGPIQPTNPTGQNPGVAYDPATAGTTGGTGGTTGTSSPYSGMWQQIIDQANHAIGLLPQQAAVGHGNIANSYQSALGDLTNQQNLAKGQYGQDTTNNQYRNQQAKTNIDQGVHQQSTALQRLFGSLGSGNSSAATILGPYAAALQGNQQRQQVQNDYGQNQQSLDNNWNNTQNQFTNSFGSLATARANRDRGLDAQLNSTQQGLLQQIAQARAYSNQAPDPNITSQINSLADQGVALGAQQSFVPPAVSYNTPSLNSYVYNPATAPIQNGAQPGQASNVGPYLSLITPQDQQKKNQTSVAPAGA